MPPLVVYLDTQDFSRFGDVLRGRGDTASEQLFQALEERRRTNGVVFAVSMPLLAELLQYHPDFRETTLRKAEAVERLCGSWALAFPSRLVAAEVAACLEGRDPCGYGADLGVLSDARYWYPDVSDAFSDLRARIRAGIPEEVAALGFTSRHARRSTASMARRMDVAKAAKEAAPEMARRFGLPERVFQASIVSFLRGRSTSEEASRTLFSAVAEPVRFVETYFEIVETDRTLPAWMRDFGERFQSSLEEMRDRVAPLMGDPGARQALGDLLAGWSPTLAAAVVRLGGADHPELGSAAGDRSGVPDDVVSAIPAGRVVGTLLPAYTRQVISAGDASPGIERSFGGDLVHALYLPHVDLWRGDRRFGALVRGALPLWGDRVVSTASDLPGRIDDALAERGRGRNASTV